MAVWYEYLPDGVSRPIILEIHHAAKWRGNADRDSIARKQAQALVHNKQFLDSRQQLLDGLGADHVTVLTIQEDDEAAPVVTNVYLPSTVTENDTEAAEKVVDWFQKSKLGKIYLKVAGEHGHKGSLTINSVSRYDSVSELGHLKEVPDPQEDHRKGHCACH